MENNKIPGKNLAIASLVLGIIAIVRLVLVIIALVRCGFDISLVPIILAIAGLVCARKSKQMGYDAGMRKAGFVLSIIALIGGVVCFITSATLFGVLALFAKNIPPKSFPQ